MLFDICQDPKETRNLAFSGPERIQQVQQLYQDILKATVDAPVQFAGDTIVRLPTDDPKKRFIGQRLHTFLHEDDDLLTLTVVRNRMFKMFHTLLYRLFLFFLGVVSVLTLLGALGVKVVVKRWKKRKAEMAAAAAEMAVVAAEARRRLSSTAVHFLSPATAACRRFSSPAVPFFSPAETIKFKAS